MNYIEIHLKTIVADHIIAIPSKWRSSSVASTSTTHAHPSANTTQPTLTSEFWTSDWNWNMKTRRVEDWSAKPEVLNNWVMTSDCVRSNCSSNVCDSHCSTWQLLVTPVGESKPFGPPISTQQTFLYPCLLYSSPWTSEELSRFLDLQIPINDFFYYMLYFKWTQ